MARIKEKYTKEVVPALVKRFNYKTPMQVPRLLKVVLNCGVGEAVLNSGVMKNVEYAFTQIAGQKPVLTKAKKAISTYKLREGLAIGCMATLRSNRMFEFFDRFVNVALPRVRDFKGVPKRGFDGRGSYSLGLKEQIIFPEVDVDKLDKIRGMSISFVTSARTDEEGRALLELLGMPFRKD